MTDLVGSARLPPTVGTEILINRSPGETRVALLEDGAVKELFFERDHDRNVVGNIYKGRVQRVLPGMQASFLNVGLDRAAFLYVDDIVVPGEEAEEEEEDLATPASEGEGEAGLAPPAESELPRPRKVRPSISELLREGQEVLVQVTKAPLGKKGARVTTYVTIPGRFVVYMPTMDRIGISRKITSEAERKRLKDIVGALRRPDEGGYIVRTVCTGLDAATIEKDMELVRSLWQDVQERSQRSGAPALLQPDLDLVLRATRDLFTDEVTRMVVDSEAEFERVKKLVERFAPHLAERIELWRDPIPLFERHGLEAAIERALQRQIHLKSGASIVIDEAEALTAIDVNTGSFVGSKDLEATILKTNLEAAKEIATQIRLRNLGGIIIIDFIDMLAPESREQVHQAFLAELARDRAKNNVLPMSPFGLMEMTRKRVRPSLGKSLGEPCPYCEGRGRLRSKQTLCHDILREVERQARLHPEGSLLVSAMPEVAAMLSEDDARRLEELEARLGRRVAVEARGDLHQETFVVSVRPSSAA